MRRVVRVRRVIGLRGMLGVVGAGVRVLLRLPGRVAGVALASARERRDGGALVAAGETRRPRQRRDLLPLARVVPGLLLVARRRPLAGLVAAGTLILGGRRLVRGGRTGGGRAAPGVRARGGVGARGGDTRRPAPGRPGRLRSAEHPAALHTTGHLV